MGHLLTAFLSTLMGILSHRFEAESVGRALELVGKRWTLLILREAFFGCGASVTSRAT
jgi:DNA-binding HxlR family transcriptional regulator